MSTDFFQRQDRARSSTKRWVGAFFLALIAIAFVLHAVFAVVRMFLTPEDEPSRPFIECFLDGTVMSVTFIFTFLIIGSASLIKIFKLRKGGPVIAKMMGATPVSPDTRDAGERRLLNVVEEMAIASGVKMPGVYVMSDENSLNAFAAGYAPESAIVAVTRGLLNTLNRDELQAVVGHEFSHILNGDMRINIRLVGILYGIFVISILGLWTMRLAASSSGGRKKDGRAALVMIVIGLSVWVVGSIGVFCGRLIQAAISRKREYLADASAVQFTRNPQALANALVLVATGPAKLETTHASEVAHMLFASAFASHPPILERIHACDPTFDGNLAAARERLLRNRIQ